MDLFTEGSSGSFSCRVYYEDTDAGGVVYYANYLKFAERARTELLRENGIEQQTLADTQGIFFVVRSVQMELHKPARLDDLLEITTTVSKRGGASVEMQQEIANQTGVTLATLIVKIACVDGTMRPKRLDRFMPNKTPN